MVVASFIVAYYITEIISLKTNITDNSHRLYMAAFMASIMGLIELFMIFYFSGSLHLILLIILLGSTFYFGYKLRTLDFLNAEQFLKSMIPHHQMAILMSEAYNKFNKIDNPELNNLVNKISHTQKNEIDYMYGLLEKL